MGKKKYFLVASVFLLFAFVIALFISVRKFPGAGEGTRYNPYRIDTLHRLQQIRNEPDAHYVLVNNIDASHTFKPESAHHNAGKGFIPVGTVEVPFSGTLNGRGYEIINLFIKRPGENHVGLFGAVSGEIRNLGLVDIDISGNNQVGGLAGLSLGGSVRDSYTTGNVKGAFETGGLLGLNSGTVETCYSSVNLGGKEYTGGLAGINTGEIVSSHFTGKIESECCYSGGLVGNNSGTIINSYARGEIKGEAANHIVIGGLVGSNSGRIEGSFAENTVDGTYSTAGGLAGVNAGLVEDSYASGSVEGEDCLGGLVGINLGTVTNSYATGPVKGGLACVGGLVGRNHERIENSYSTGQITGTAIKQGLVGTNYGSVVGSYCRHK